jgi:regulator of nonsense transcripts 1
MKVLIGEVMVTKAPCCHPGDIQIFECVDVQELRYLSNVIVFSSKCKFRPDQNKMSCGDLDGDIYFITMNE